MKFSDLKANTCALATARLSASLFTTPVIDPLLIFCANKLMENINKITVKPINETFKKFIQTSS
jgi:hypothetical protein